MDLGYFLVAFFFIFFLFGLFFFFFLFLFSISWKCVKILTFECHTLRSVCEIKDISLKETYAPCSLFWFPVQLVTMHLHFAHTFGFATRAVLLRKGCKLFSLTFGCQLGPDCSGAGMDGTACTHSLQLPLWPPAPGHSGSFVEGCCLRWPPAGEGLFPGAFLSLLLHLTPFPVCLPTHRSRLPNLSGRWHSVYPTFSLYISSSSCILWEMPEISLSLSGSALESTVEMLAALRTLCLRQWHVFSPSHGAGWVALKVWGWGWRVTPNSLSKDNIGPESSGVWVPLWIMVVQLGKYHLSGWEYGNHSCIFWYLTWLLCNSANLVSTASAGSTHRSPHKLLHQILERDDG